jgi:hypothetical protein
MVIMERPLTITKRKYLTHVYLWHRNDGRSAVADVLFEIGS